MVRASYRSSEGCGFDPRLGLRNHFLSTELEDHSSIVTCKVMKFSESKLYSNSLASLDGTIINSSTFRNKNRKMLYI